MEQKINKKILKIILCFISTFEKHLQSNQYQDLFFEIRHIRTKYVYFLFRLNIDFGFFIKSWRNRLCIGTIWQERVDLDCNIWGSLPFKLTTIGEVWWPIQLRGKGNLLVSIIFSFSHCFQKAFNTGSWKQWIAWLKVQLLLNDIG